MKRLMAVDLDGTMVGNSEALAELNAELHELRITCGLALAYVTGRTRGSALTLIEETDLLRPDFLIADVGGSICSGPDWTEDSGWRHQVARGWHPSRLRALTSMFPALEPQPSAHQGEFKLSYRLCAVDARATLALVSDSLKRHRLRARLVYSSGRDLDFVPARAGKAGAVAYLAGRNALDPSRIFTCGDSGNDADMLNAGYRSAAVGNSQPELLEAIPPCVYRARGCFAAGVHEALQHYGWLSAVAG